MLWRRHRSAYNEIEQPMINPAKAEEEREEKRERGVDGEDLEGMRARKGEGVQGKEVNWLGRGEEEAQTKG